MSSPASSSAKRIEGSTMVPMADVLSRAGHELAQLAWLLEQLQTRLSPLIQEAAERDPGDLRHMQSLDHAGQQAMGLAEFLAALALAAPCEWRIDPSAAAHQVLLADLSARLGFKDSSNESRHTAWGECEFF
jgi:hypothetical protein